MLAAVSMPQIFAAGVSRGTSDAVSNFGMVTEGIYRGGRPTGEPAYKYLADLGVKTVVNLQYMHTDDKALCKKYGLNCVDFKLFASAPPADYIMDWDKFKQAYAFVLDEKSAGRKVFFHCLYGSDRTGMLAATIKMRESACGSPSVDKDKLWEQTQTVLKECNFHKVFGDYTRHMKEMVYKFEDNRSWICK